MKTLPNFFRKKPDSENMNTEIALIKAAKDVKEIQDELYKVCLERDNLKKEVEENNRLVEEVERLNTNTLHYFHDIKDKIEKK